MDNNTDIQIMDDDDDDYAPVTAAPLVVSYNPVGPSSTGGLVIYRARVHDGIARSLALLGYSDELIAQQIGITYESFINWVKDSETLVEALSEGRVSADAKVVSALFRAATGYETKETIEELGANGMQVTRILTKQVAPNVGAAKQWLSARQPELWKDSLQPDELDGSLTTYFDKLSAKKIAESDDK